MCGDPPIDDSGGEPLRDNRRCIQPQAISLGRRGRQHQLTDATPAEKRNRDSEYGKDKGEVLQDIGQIKSSLEHGGKLNPTDL